MKRKGLPRSLALQNPRKDNYVCVPQAIDIKNTNLLCLLFNLVLIMLLCGVLLCIVLTKHVGYIDKLCGYSRLISTTLG